MTTAKQIKDWYNYKYRTSGEDLFRPYHTYPHFLNYLPVKPGQKLLDIGCGTGHLAKASIQRKLITFGIDISLEAIKIAQVVSPETVFLVSQGENLPFKDNYFDYIFCLGTLEHFLDMKKSLQDIKRVAAQDALFFIMVPNRNFLYFKLRRFSGTEQQEINEHLLSLGEWKQLLRKEGLVITAIHSENWFNKGQERKFLSLSPVKTAKVIGLNLIDHFLPLYYCYQFIFLCRQC